MTHERKKELRKRIKEIVKYIWMNEIREDYNNNIFLCEDTLKSDLYFHLRRYLKSEIELDNIRIYTEYYVKEASAKADIVIAYLNPATLKELDKTRKYYYTKEGAEPLAVFELKFKNYSKGENDFIDDINKVKDRYMSASELLRCDYYLGFISEYGYDNQFWLDKGKHKNSKIIELTAIYNCETEEMDWACH